MGISLGILNDPWLMAVSTGIATAWYGLGHDEYLNLHHVKHHRYINSDYTAYVPRPGHDSLDRVRALVKERNKAK
jgi:hypothetical protein